MSISYWAIQGLGIDISGEIFDRSKLNKLFEIKSDNDKEKVCFGDLYLMDKDIYTQDILDEILFSSDKFEKHRQYLSYGDTGSNDNGEYLYYAPSYPWDMKNEEKNMSKDEIIQMIIDILSELTILTKEEIIEQIEDISVGGQG